MFGVLRIIIGIIIGYILFLCVSKFKRVTAKSSFNIIIIVVLFVTVLGFVPFENCLYKFRSAEEVYKYYSFSEKKVEIIIEGEQSDLVVGKKNETSSFLIVPKTADNWKIGISLDTKKIVEKFFDRIIVYVYHYRNTNDYFIFVSDINGRELNLSDEFNTKFYSLKKNDFVGKDFVTYYAHVSEIYPQYSIIVNGNKIRIIDQSEDGSVIDKK